MTDPRVRAGMERQLEARRRALEGGARPLGWKLGFGAAAARERLGLDAPLVGYLLEGARLPTGATVSLAGWTAPVAEPEIAVHLGRDLAATDDPDDVRAAIAALGPAIELADLSFAPEDVEAILAGDVYQRHVVLGPRDETRAGGRVDGLVGRVERDGAPLGAARDPTAATGEVVGNVMHVASLLAAMGETLRAGEVILLGSILPPIQVERSATIRYALDPIGEISVALEGGPGPARIG